MTRSFRTSLAATPPHVYAVTACLLWIFWPTFEELAHRWGSQSQYSHGYLVPFFTVFLLYSRRRLLPDRAWKNPSWWGFPLLSIGLALRFAGTYLYFDWLTAMALLPCLVGLVLLFGGWAALRWAWPAIAFLAFMVPLPFRVEVALAHPLQRVATLVSTYLLQTLGFVAFGEGNVIVLGDVRIGVVEACSGLSMLVIFFALSTAVTLVSTRSPLERAVLFLSAVPIALSANIIRILVTAILHKTVGHDWADYVFHDLAGWMMMPLALGMLWLEIRVFQWVLAPRTDGDLEALEFNTWGPAQKAGAGDKKAAGPAKPAAAAAAQPAGASTKTAAMPESAAAV